MIRSVVAYNPYAARKLLWLYLPSVVRYRSYCRLKFCIAGIGMFALLCFCDLDLDLMTFIYEFDPHPQNFLRQGFQKLSYYIHTFYRQMLLPTLLHTTPLRGC